MSESCKRLSVPTYAALRAMPAPTTHTGSVPNESHATSKPATKADPQRELLEHFMTFSIASGINSLGVLLEILHLADYDFARATRIADLVRQSPPAAAAAITEYAPPQNAAAGTNPMEGPFQSGEENPVGAVQAFGNGCTAAASAASQYSVAVVGVGLNSAGVAVGTSAGTTTSTAVPLSAVTSLPGNSTVNVNLATPGDVDYNAVPNSRQQQKGTMATNPATNTANAPAMIMAGQPQQSIASRGPQPGMKAPQPNGITQASHQQQQRQQPLKPFPPAPNPQPSVPASVPPPQHIPATHHQPPPNPSSVTNNAPTTAVPAPTTQSPIPQQTQQQQTSFPSTNSHSQSTAAPPAMQSTSIPQQRQQQPSFSNKMSHSQSASPSFPAPQPQFQTEAQQPVSGSSGLNGVAPSPPLPHHDGEEEENKDQHHHLSEHLHNMKLEDLFRHLRHMRGEEGGQGQREGQGQVQVGASLSP